MKKNKAHVTRKDHTYTHTHTHTRTHKKNETKREDMCVCGTRVLFFGCFLFFFFQSITQKKKDKQKKSETK